MIDDGEAVRFDWRRGGAAAAGLVMALVLVIMVFAVKFANDARERALDAERQSNQVALVVRNVSANISRAEAALARFVLDEDVKTSGNIYASDWQLAAYQINQLKLLEQGSPAQRVRVAELQQLYDRRDKELAVAARAAVAKQGDTGISYFYAAASTGTGRALDDKLEEIIRAEREALRGRFGLERLDPRVDHCLAVVDPVLHREIPSGVCRLRHCCVIHVSHSSNSFPRK